MPRLFASSAAPPVAEFEHRDTIMYVIVSLFRQRLCDYVVLKIV